MSKLSTLRPKVNLIVNHHALVLKTTVCYSEVAAACGVLPQSGHIGTILREMAEEDTQAGRPMRNFAVVNKSTRLPFGTIKIGSRRPSERCFADAKELGYKFKDEEAFFLEQMALLGINRLSF